MRINPAVSETGAGAGTAGPNPLSSGGAGSGALDLRMLLRVLRWRIRLIATLAIAAAAIAAAALVVIPAQYKALTIVLVDPRQPRVTASEAVLSGIGADAAAVESQVELIRSSALARRVIEKFQLGADPEFAKPSLIDGVRRLVRFGAAEDETERLNRIVYRFQRQLSVQRRGLTYILEIGFSSVDPRKAARISGAIADAYLDDQRSAKTDVTTRASGWLGSRIDELRRRLERSERAVADYKASNNMVDVTQGNKLIARQIEDITQQLALARSRKAEALGRIERVKQAGRDPANTAALGEVLQSQVVGTLRSQYAEAARQEADLRALYGERHPSVVAIRAQVVDLRRQVDREIARVVEGIRNDYEVARSREAALESELAALQERSEKLNRADVRLRELEREAQADRTLFEQFLIRAKETSQQESLQIAEARIVSPALTPIRPERPGALVLLAVAAFLGGLLGVGLVLVLEQLRRGLRGASDVEQWLGLPTLGVLPDQSGDERGTAVEQPADPHAPARHVLAFPASDYAGSLWAIMTRLRRSPDAPASKEILAITSAAPGEGKSTFASNLALASAASGARTLLVDGDPYTASVSRIFDLKRPGVSELLEGRVKFWNAVSRDPKSGLHILGARDLKSAAREFAGSEGRSIAKLLRDLREHFDLIVVDSPAILPVDGGMFVEHADRAVFIVAWESTGRGAVKEALGMLGVYRAKLAGVVLNRASPRWYRLFGAGRYLRYSTAQLANVVSRLSDRMTEKSAA